MAHIILSLAIVLGFIWLLVAFPSFRVAVAILVVVVGVGLYFLLRGAPEQNAGRSQPSTQPKDMTAGELLNYCKKSEAEGSYCATYIAGFVGGISQGEVKADMMQSLCLPPMISDAQMGAFRQRFMAETENGILNTAASTVQAMLAPYVLSFELQGMFPCPAGSNAQPAEAPPPVSSGTKRY